MEKPIKLIPLRLTPKIRLKFDFEIKNWNETGSRWRYRV